MTYQRGKVQQVIKSVRKTIKRLLPSKIKVQVSFTGKKLSSCFNINDKTKFEHRHNVIYLETCPETKCNDNYIGEAKLPIFDMLKITRAETLNHTFKTRFRRQSSTCFTKKFKDNW